MGQRSTKIDRANANVINEIEVGHNEVNLETIEVCLVIITILAILNVGLSIYSMHNRKLKKKYMSRANNLDKI